MKSESFFASECCNISQADFLVCHEGSETRNISLLIGWESLGNSNIRLVIGCVLGQVIPVPLLCGWERSVNRNMPLLIAREGSVICSASPLIGWKGSGDGTIPHLIGLGGSWQQYSSLPLLIGFGGS
jgi:hypothetical protein